MSSASARNKQKPLFSGYLSHATLTSMYNSIISVKHQDYRIVSTTLHLIIEICLKKLALYYGLSVSVTSHSLNNILFELQSKDSTVSSIYKELGRTGELRYLQRFPYDDLRFKEDVVLPKIKLITMANVAHTLLARLNYIEGKGF